MKSADGAHQRRHHHRRQQDHQRRAARRRRTTPAQVVDASNLTVMPGLIEFHSHLQTDFGESQGRAWLAFGITTVRSPGNTPYEAVEEREANEAGVRPGPRVYGTGYLMEWQRVYYKMGIAISSVAQFEMELQRAKVLQHDLIKSYVRLPDLQQKRMVEFAHSIGIPVATHEIYPGGVRRRRQHRAHLRDQPPRLLAEDGDAAAQLRGRRSSCSARAGRISDADDFGGGARGCSSSSPALKNDPRFKLYPEWMQRAGRAQPATGSADAGGDPTGGSGKMVLDVMRAGGLIVAGTDTPNAINLHGELMAYTLAGMTPFEALKAATVNPAKALGARRRHDRGRQARRPRHRRRRSARRHRERAQGEARHRQRPRLRDESAARCDAGPNDIGRAISRTASRCT